MFLGLVYGILGTLGCQGCFSSWKHGAERIKEEPRALRHAPLTNIQKCLLRIFATVHFVRTFFDHLFLQRFGSCAVLFLTIHFWACFFVYMLLTIL